MLHLVVSFTNVLNWTHCNDREEGEEGIERRSSQLCVLPNSTAEAAAVRSLAFNNAGRWLHFRHSCFGAKIKFHVFFSCFYLCLSPRSMCCAAAACGVRVPRCGMHFY